MNSETKRQHHFKTGDYSCGMRNVGVPRKFFYSCAKIELFGKERELRHLDDLSLISRPVATRSVQQILSMWESVSGGQRLDTSRTHIKKRYLHPETLTLLAIIEINSDKPGMCHHGRTNETIPYNLASFHTRPLKEPWRNLPVAQHLKIPSLFQPPPRIYEKFSEPGTRYATRGPHRFVSCNRSNIGGVPEPIISRRFCFVTREFKGGIRREWFARETETKRYNGMGDLGWVHKRTDTKWGYTKDGEDIQIDHCLPSPCFISPKLESKAD